MQTSKDVSSKCRFESRTAHRNVGEFPTFEVDSACNLEKKSTYSIRRMVISKAKRSTFTEEAAQDYERSPCTSEPPPQSLFRCAVVFVVCLLAMGGSGFYETKPCSSIHEVALDRLQEAPNSLTGVWLIGTEPSLLHQSLRFVHVVERILQGIRNRAKEKFHIHLCGAYSPAYDLGRQLAPFGCPSALTGAGASRMSNGTLRSVVATQQGELTCYIHAPGIRTDILSDNCGFLLPRFSPSGVGTHLI